MFKLYIYLLLLALACAQNASQGTEGFYLSPHGISRQREVHDALEKVMPRIHIQRTTYQHGGINYIIDNCTLEVAYLDGKQTIEIKDHNDVSVSGGRLEILYKFNFTKKDGSSTVNGNAWGSVISDSLNYTKELTFGHDGHLIWALMPNNESYTDLTIFNRMHLKRIEPYNETDIGALEDMLDRAITLIEPSTIEHQFLSTFNSIMPLNLNNTLNSYILGNEIDYTFHHHQKGELNLSIVHHNYGFDIDPVDGYKVLYLTEIKDWPDPVCNGKNVPDKHLSFDFYGGSQNIHMNCLYQSVLQYIQSKGWLDVKLDSSWECNAFQFFSGDLYDLINNLYLKVNPREIIEGECKANKNGLSIKHGRQLVYNMYAVDIQYQCTLSTRDKQLRNIQVMDFTADIQLIVEAAALKTELAFTIQTGQALNLSFKPVGDFYVNNLNLAMFKVDQILQKLKGQRVFGTGFPSLAREYPKTEVGEDYVIYYDGSHTKSNLFNQ